MIGVVVLNYNTWALAIRCIARIEQVTTVPHKIYAVDNASPDGSCGHLESEFAFRGWKAPGIELIAAGENGGYSAGNNIGIKCALADGCEHILIINSDVVLENDAIALMSDALRNTDEIAVVGPAVFDSNGFPAHYVRAPLDFVSYIANKKPFNRFMCSGGKEDRHEPRNIKIESGSELFVFDGMVSGCCFMMKSAAFLKTGLLDENVFLNHEEDILAYKIKEAGYRCGFLKTAKVVHHHSSSVSKQGSAFERYHRYLSSIYVLKVYAHEPLFRLLVAALLNIAPFALNSVRNSEYAKRLSSFLRANVDIIVSSSPSRIRA
jgi:GT2 family glycosyltransferase